MDACICTYLTLSLPVTSTFLKEYLINFLMVTRLIDFVLAVLELLMFKVYGKFGISKIEFLNFSKTEKIKYSKAFCERLVSPKGQKFI